MAIFLVIVYLLFYRFPRIVSVSLGRYYELTSPAFPYDVMKARSMSQTRHETVAMPV